MQTTLVKNYIVHHQGSSPTPIFTIVAVLTKGIEILAHKVTLLTAKVQTLYRANKALSKRQRAKKTCICQGGILTIEDTHDIVARKDTEEQVRHNKCFKEGD